MLYKSAASGAKKLTATFVSYDRCVMVEFPGDKFRESLQDIRDIASGHVKRKLITYHQRLMQLYGYDSVLNVLPILRYRLTRILYLYLCC